MIPEVRQCQTPGIDFGAVAVKNPEIEGLWFIGDPTSSGRWGTDDDVQNWSVAVEWEAPTAQAPPEEIPIEETPEDEEELNEDQ